MMEIIFMIFLIVGLCGMGVIFIKKMSVLSELPEADPVSLDLKTFFQKARETQPLKRISLEVVLQKALSKTRVLILKSDNKTSSWLQKLREKSQKDKFGENDSYWKDIRKSTRE
ncbi:MAG: hypothetical protein ABH831_00765 [Candidatus Nealsonbacteria bacterium]